MWCTLWWTWVCDLQYMYMGRWWQPRKNQWTGGSLSGGSWKGVSYWLSSLLLSMATLIQKWIQCHYQCHKGFRSNWYWWAFPDTLPQYDMPSTSGVPGTAGSNCHSVLLFWHMIMSCFGDWELLKPVGHTIQIICCSTIDWSSVDLSWSLFRQSTCSYCKNHIEPLLLTQPCSCTNIILITLNEVGVCLQHC